LRLRAALRQHGAQEAFAFQNVGLEAPNADGVQIAMPAGVVAQLEPGVEPIPEHLDALGTERVIGVQQSFVDEPDDGHVCLLERGDQARMLRGQVGWRRVAQHDPGHVVEGEGDAMVASQARCGPNRQRCQHRAGEDAADPIHERGHGRSVCTLRPANKPVARRALASRSW